MEFKIDKFENHTLRTESEGCW